MTFEELEGKAFVYYLRTGIRIDLEKFINSIEYKSLLKELDFAEEVSNGTILFIGEGNFSFSLSLASNLKEKSRYFIATSFESKKEVSDETIENSKKLEAFGANVLFGINGTKLENYFQKIRFDRIIFNFPNTASRDGKYGKTENHYLLKNFLKSSANILKPDGKVIVSIVDTRYYKGMFDFENLNLPNYNKPKIYQFNPEKYIGYSHTMTHKDENGLEKYDSFISLVFTLK